MGPQGPAGANGTYCWDLNQNGVPDPASEDLNGDLTVDVKDCTGPQGPAGPGALIFTYGQDLDYPLGSNPCSPYLGIFVDAPGPGTVVITAFLDVSISHTAGFSETIWFSINAVSATCPGEPWSWIEQVPGALPTATYQVAGYVQGIFLVTGPGTIYVNGYVTGPGADSADLFLWGNAIATWYPS